MALSDARKKRLCKYKRKKPTPRPDNAPLETVEEFLARGGKVSIIPTNPTFVEEPTRRPAITYTVEQ